MILDNSNKAAFGSQPLCLEAVCNTLNFSTNLSKCI